MIILKKKKSIFIKTRGSDVTGPLIIKEENKHALPWIFVGEFLIHNFCFFFDEVVFIHEFLVKKKIVLC